MSTYLLCGNAIIASGTEGQELFMKQYPGIGQTYTSGNATQLAEAITKYHSNKQLLQDHRRNGYKLAAGELNWEKEQQLFLAAVNKALS
jgi:glycosyltransferase involved in cell wall biosynthesis